MRILEDQLSPEKKTLFFRVSVIVLTLIISLLYGFMHLLWLNELHWDYENAILITSLQAWDAYHYLGQVKEVYEGNYGLANTYLAEYKTAKRPFWWPVLPVYIAAFMGKLLHLQVQYLAVIMDFTLPPLIFLLGYWLLYTVSSIRHTSIFGAFVLLLIPFITRIDRLMATTKYRFASLQHFVPSILEPFHCYNCFSRPVYPQLVYIFLLASLLFFFKGITSRKNSYFVLSAFFGIITTYSYYYFSTYLYVFLGLGAIIAFIMKNRFYGSRSFLVLGVTLMFSIPFWFSLVTFSNEKLQEMWSVKSHTPIFNVQILFILLLCLLVLGGMIKRYVSELTGIVSLTLLLSCVICFNQHVVSGTIVEYGHYSWYVIPQAIVLAGTLLAAEYKKRWHTHRFRRFIKPIPIGTSALYGGIFLGSISLLLNPSFVAQYLSSDGILVPKVQFLLEIIHVYGSLLGLLLLISGLILKRSFPALYIRIGTILYLLVTLYIITDITIARYELYQSRIKPRFGYLQELAPALQWLNKHTEKESVILGSLDDVATESVIMVYTHNNVYVSPYAQFYSVPSVDEVKDRVYNLLYFWGVTPQKDFEQFIQREALSIFVYRLGLSFDEFQEKLQKELHPELKKYQVDYVFYGPRERENFTTDPAKTHSFLKEVYHDEIVTIYQIL